MSNSTQTRLCLLSSKFSQNKHLLPYASQFAADTFWRNDLLGEVVVFPQNPPHFRSSEVAAEWRAESISQKNRQSVSLLWPISIGREEIHRERVHDDDAARSYVRVTRGSPSWRARRWAFKSSWPSPTYSVWEGVGAIPKWWWRWRFEGEFGGKKYA